jgi:hypothetical protein
MRGVYSPNTGFESASFSCEAFSTSKNHVSFGYGNKRVGSLSILKGFSFGSLFSTGVLY